ncbi:CDP-diacylglycerol--glycerol-3-phosphate 3-phosphatidyltransferase [Aneurinibacillus aneurinilyticus]|uniref:CDP-diacylglycerol--glycerol-3-phosphate 3-phosphatidyltransferase n=2 Tax=Aneurinibacillus aneurinilyticus TaxID=1391 RepID=A0A848CUH6_ANEAE|nr:CDP-diacylglycerol--glycerol-3-phosphate 3-phosphatidyltransferase [Aneurinibacillus aneurinilyticus]ERI08294.1 CDP-diacylglycerol--glycerol-3-phosphate 3-phosphatidyltransferase [Aneurinibacillus aneurinilyticus ATCC 12856]MCI1692906.1 CDP-diacylglycerol--glycerol-3-phosphate 3-phosphatidyltransferase [Aneurinibacillus aneurinilyticus]MED0669800.1 CDP-diacylglycerol--glycerol-3-phosphate 3-phosphatidyltransferase [Aneurinibacillus aneurinilyticus]MED0705709.1 CDP-diacylglycerol--glycerol-3-
MNLANRITLARIFLVPVVMIFLLVQFDNLGSFKVGGVHITYSECIAAIVFIIAAITDGLDGYIARSRKMVTNLGKFLDPLADKLLISAVLISLVEMQRLDAWVAVVIISREFAVTGLRLVAAAEGLVIAASKLGKWKTVLQIVAVAALILQNFPFETWHFPFATIMVWAAVIMTIVSGVEYFLKNKKVIPLA